MEQLSVDEEMVRDAVRRAAEELAHVCGMQPRERIFQEAQLQCALYQYFRRRGMSVHVEAGYAGNQLQKCDLVVHSPPCPETWIELKIASHSRNANNRQVLHNKPAEFRNRWQRDVNRLLDPGLNNACKIFILLGLFDFDPNNGQGCALLNRVNTFYPQNRLLEDAGHQWLWQDINVSGKFWVWQWRPVGPGQASQATNHE